MAKIFCSLIFLCCLVLSTGARVNHRILSSSTLGLDDATPTGSNFTFVCDPARYSSLGLEASNFAFCDTSLSYEVRAMDLVNQMTLTEKVHQLGNKAYGVPRLGLAAYEWWSEALHGVSNVGPGTFFDDLIPGSTSFPTVITTAAAFNESLWKVIGQAVSTEARAIAIETPGEDPYVVGRYAVNYVRGLQDVEGSENYTDPNSRPLKVSSCCKHYAAYDVDNWKGVERYTFDARVSEQDMVETFLRPFEMCVKDGDVSSIMCSYNRVNGIPTCADPKLLNQTIRGDWDLHGYIVSDCDSLQVMVDDHKWLGDTKEDAVAQTLKAGLDLDCGDYYTDNVEAAVRQGKVREADIDKSLNFLYVVLLRLGFFDGIPQYNSFGKNDVCSKENIELATEAAREGTVLLKNENNSLPFSIDKVKTLAVVGPHSNATSAMIGNYAGIPCQIITPIDGLSKFAKVDYQMGCSDVACKNESFIFPAMEAAKKADATIIFAGIDLSVEAESLDRDDLLLPGYQTQLINQVASVANGPVVLVLMSAGGVDISFAKRNENIKSILWVGYPGEEGGNAIADVIFGKYNPGGRLPLTWHEADYVDMLPMTSMPLRPIDSLGYPGRTYKFFNGSTVYPFGYGLSYTQVARSNLPAPSIRVDNSEYNDRIEFEVEVQNVGTEDGSEVVIVYAKPPEGIDATYIKQVIGIPEGFCSGWRQ
ncbi:SUGAR HYDROLASE-RELATED [Salix koriyanagi]|uniref:SUGAR HYDROLASE-RELATED n=1 Tax=Salix koriyanagi TaxID=2511006 RepID=A0A9Q0UP46_9ROSI|nr:SUGAR HYDROLASE-RELATED [Salix koriyanagi]